MAPISWGSKVTTYILSIVAIDKYCSSLIAVRSEVTTSAGKGQCGSKVIQMSLPSDVTTTVCKGQFEVEGN